jgi:hypothetical protein
MEPEDSLPCSQEPATGPYTEPDESNPHPPTYMTKIHFNIILHIYKPDFANRQRSTNHKLADNFLLTDNNCSEICTILTPGPFYQNSYVVSEVTGKRTDRQCLHFTFSGSARKLTFFRSLPVQIRSQTSKEGRAAAAAGWIISRLFTAGEQVPRELGHAHKGSLVDAVRSGMA